MTDKKYDVEVVNTRHEFRFRLVEVNVLEGVKPRKSGWANYAQIAMLDDTVAVSPFYAGGQDIQIMAAKAMVKLIAVGEAP